MIQVETSREETILRTDIITVIKGLMKENKITQTAMAQELGVSKQSLHQRLASNADLKFEQVVEMLGVMGFQLLIRKKPADQKSNNVSDQTSVG